MISRPAQALGFGWVRARWRASRTGVQLLDAHRGYRCTTSVVRVPPDAAARMAEVARALPGSSDHYVYPPGDLHLTVVNLDAARLPDLELLEATERAAAAVRPFAVELRGLAMTGQSVYVQVWDPTGSLWRLRGAVAAATGSDLSLSRRLLGFVNLVRFTHPRVEGVLADGARGRRLALGTFDVDEVEVVRTDKVLSVAATTTLGRVRLG